MNRRDFVRTAGGATAAVAAASAAPGTAAAVQDDEDDQAEEEEEEEEEQAEEEEDGGENGGGDADGEPDFEGYLEGIDGGIENLRGEDEVTVEVGADGNGGNLAFSPAGIWIDEGTTVTWEWTGQGGAHNVVATDDAPFDNVHDIDSGDPTDEEGETYEETFEEGGRTGYVCEPHEGVGMLGAIAVGDDVPVAETEAAGGWPEDITHVGVPFHPHWIGLIASVSIALTIVFTFYVLKYGESAHTGHGGR